MDIYLVWDADEAIFEVSMEIIILWAAHAESGSSLESDAFML